jgi:hypothetical protein
VLRAVASCPPVLPPPEGTIADRFVLVRELGAGGSGVVYEAIDRRDRQRVALKLLRQGSPSWLHRFKREFRLLRGFHHPNLVTLRELVSSGGRWFFTMELIGGVDFVSHVRAGPSLERCRDCVRQLLAVLAVLHATGKVHRDIKPSNVLVTPKGRVVLLDFGLVADTMADDPSADATVVGTPGYMAPEQARGGKASPAADLYAVGVMLHEILADGATLVDHATVAARSDLVGLCESLLRRDPALRPSAADAARRLLPARMRGVALRANATNATNATDDAHAAAFVARDAELGDLRGAFERTLRGEPTPVLVSGESGAGKSPTILRFRQRVLTSRPDALVLVGRCDERETIPYKTLDAVVDALARWLSRLPPSVVEALLPSHLSALTSAFPAFLGVSRVAGARSLVLAPTAPRPNHDRHTLPALRELFLRVARRYPTVVLVDDVHWADDEGLRALAAVFAPPEPPPLLFVGTLRPSDGGMLALDALSRAFGPRTRHVRLGRLGDSTAMTDSTTHIDFVASQIASSASTLHTRR